MNKPDYIETNRQMWELTAAVYEADGFEHALKRVQSPDFTTFDEVEREIFLHHINLTGLDVMQVGCNNGIELICLKKSGANRCVGTDISERFIQQAKWLAQASGYSVDFDCVNSYDLAEKYTNQFDLVYITVGVLGWMPNLDQLFGILNKILKQDGRLLIYEQHPILGAFNPIPPHRMDASYFQTEPFLDELIPEYIDQQGQHKAPSYWFQHTLGAILTHCINHRFQLTHFQEYAKDLSDTYKLLENEVVPLPLSFSLIAQRV